MSGFKKTIEFDFPATAAGSDLAIPKRVPFDGVVTKVTFIPKATLTGANTDSRDIVLTNKGQGGTGTTNILTKHFTSGANAPVYDETDLSASLNGTAANLNVSAGDVIEAKSLHVGAGLADPGGLLSVTIQRS